jgi:hypothetical protein
MFLSHLNISNWFSFLKQERKVALEFLKIQVWVPQRVSTEKQMKQDEKCIFMFSSPDKCPEYGFDFDYTNQPRKIQEINSLLVERKE